MRQPINIARAKARLSELVDRCLAGAEVIISRRNKPVVRLVIERPAEKQLRPGRYADRATREGRVSRCRGGVLADGPVK
ncbi:MAG: prevent-host-death family protein [Myxococcota bacterium]|jgi:prevent-host-death family protein